MAFVVLVLALIAVFVLLGMSGSFFTIASADAGIVQRLGKFHRTAQPGWNFKLPFIDVLVNAAK